MFNRTVAALILLFQLTPLLATEAIIVSPERIVSIGGGVTEIIYALDQQHRLVGADTTSTWPQATEKLPKVGYQRTLSAEGILSLTPDLVIATTHAGPPSVIQQVRAAGVPVLIVTGESSLAGLEQRIRRISVVFAVEASGAELIQATQLQLHRIQQQLADIHAKPKVLFLLAHGQRTPLAAGQNTATDSIIQLAGGINAITGYHGYKPLTSEAIVKAEPDVILLTEQGLENLGGLDNFLSSPTIRLTSAAQNKRVIAIDALLLLSFGPRLPTAVNQLAEELHADSDWLQDQQSSVNSLAASRRELLSGKD